MLGGERRALPKHGKNTDPRDPRDPPRPSETAIVCIVLLVLVVYSCTGTRSSSSSSTAGTSETAIVCKLVCSIILHSSSTAGSRSSGLGAPGAGSPLGPGPTAAPPSPPRPPTVVLLPTFARALHHALAWVDENDGMSHAAMGGSPRSVSGLRGGKGVQPTSRVLVLPSSSVHSSSLLCGLRLYHQLLLR